jgi:hypothetical protein
MKVKVMFSSSKCFFVLLEFKKMKLKALLLANFKIISQRSPRKKLALYRCKYCTQEYAFHITRMSKHLTDNCKGCPDTIKSTIKQKQRLKKLKPVNSNCAKDDSKRKRELSPSSEDEVECDEVQSETDRTVQISRFVDKTSPRDQEYIEEILATALYVTGKYTY